MRVFGANGIEIQLIGCLRDVPLEICGVRVLGNFLVGSDDADCQRPTDILIDCNIIRKIEETSNGNDMKPRATWSRVFESICSHVRQAKFDPPYPTWELRVQTAFTSGPNWIGARQARCIPCPLIGPDVQSVDLLYLYYESSHLRQITYGSENILVGDHLQERNNERCSGRIKPLSY